MTQGSGGDPSIAAANFPPNIPAMRREASPVAHHRLVCWEQQIVSQHSGKSLTPPIAPVARDRPQFDFRQALKAEAGLCVNQSLA